MDRRRPLGGWPGNLSPEERRIHQVLAEVREGLDAARLAGATGLDKIALYALLEGLRRRGLVEIYPGPPVLFYCRDGKGFLPPSTGPLSPGGSLAAISQGGGGPRTYPQERRPLALPLSGPSPAPSPTTPLQPSPSAGEPGLYLAWEPRPGRSLAAYRAAVRRGAPGLLIGRSPTSAEPGARLSLGETGPPPRAERLDEVVRAVRHAGPGAAVLLDGLEYLVAKHGFDSVLRMVFSLRELAALHRAVLFIPADPRALEPKQRALLEREARVL